MSGLRSTSLDPNPACGSERHFGGVGEQLAATNHQDSFRSSNLGGLTSYHHDRQDALPLSPNLRRRACCPSDQQLRCISYQLGGKFRRKASSSFYRPRLTTMSAALAHLHIPPNSALERCCPATKAPGRVPLLSEGAERDKQPRPVCKMGQAASEARRSPEGVGG